MVVEEFREYLAYEKRFSVHTTEAYIKDITQFTSYINDLGIEFLYAVSSQQIRLWVVHLVENNYQASSLHRKLSSLNTFYKFSIRKGYTTINPAKGIQLPKLPSRLPKYVEQKNIENFLNHMQTNEDDFVSIRNKVVIEILYATGIRRQELLNLKWKDIDENLKQVKILGKGNKERIVPISNELIQLLLTYKITCKKHFENFDSWGQLILSDNGGKAYPVLIYRIVHSTLKEAEVKTQKSPHVLRHTFATHLSNQGAPLNDIKELLGHASLASTQVYTHNSIEKLKEIFKHSHPKA
ncbi:MAG: tyrosine-type recombinase/integrase [Chitinophagales bacterium]|nr:tyrosine-type recombinase/integrase [Chitinophagales bacterium]